MYLFAVIDWYSRKVMSWELSNTLDTGFCLKGLQAAVKEYGHPAIVNTDQGCQFTSDEGRTYLANVNIRQSMGGRGRWVDNVVIERFWRTIKYEDIYLKSYDNPVELEKRLEAFIKRYNNDRPHQSLNGITHDQIYFEKIRRAA